MNRFISLIENDLIPQLEARSVSPVDPIVVRRVPEPWQLLGAGNYATVVGHPDYPDRVVKVYAPGRPGIEAETEVYRRLGSHPAYSECYHVGGNYLVLRRLRGITLFECLRRGIRIPEQVIHDVDEALVYARNRGLYPNDVHGKNVMMHDGRGLVVDVSDFLEQEPCHKWDHLKNAYYKYYRRTLSRFPVPVPLPVLNLIRKSYRLYTRYFASSD